jgi:nickel-dependent lactate racemase
MGASGAFTLSTGGPISIPYGDGAIDLHIPHGHPMALLAPRPAPPAPDPLAEIRRALANPIGALPLGEAACGACKVVIAADDLTRQTPVELIIPILLDELNRAGVPDEAICVLIALGTHRPMSVAEIEAHFGPEVVRRVRVLNNPWQDPTQMVDLGVTANGTPVEVSRLAHEADFLIGVGSIVPHHIPGYSAGGKIIQPGLSGAATTGATHYLSTRTRRSYLGLVENPVRQEIDQIAARVGLKAILNVVLNPDGSLVRAFYGDFVQAHRAGVEVSRQVNGAEFDAQADIVIAGSHPCDIEFWQAHKSLYPADMAVKEGGTIIVVTPCPEGVSVTHHGMLAFTGLSAERIDELIQDGTIADRVSGALALAWAKVRQRATVYLVSGGISAEEARALAFQPFSALDEALAAALHRHGVGATVNVLPYAPDTLPILRG